MLQLPVNLIRHPLLPWPVELSTLGRVSFIRVIASRGQAESICLNQESKQWHQGGLVSTWAALLRTLPPIGTSPEEIQMEKALPANLQHPITCSPAHLDQAAACYS